MRIYICKECGKKFKDYICKKRIFCSLSCTNRYWGRGRNYKDGISLYRKYIKKEKCERCGGKRNLIIHHRNHNRHDNNLQNLQVLCFSCHQKEHKVYRNFKEAYKRTKRNRYGRFGKEKPIAIIKCLNCGKNIEKNNPRQKYCKKCHIKLNTGKLTKRQLEKLKNEINAMQKNNGKRI